MDESRQRRCRSTFDQSGRKLAPGAEGRPHDWNTLAKGFAHGCFHGVEGEVDQTGSKPSRRPSGASLDQVRIFDQEQRMAVSPLGCPKEPSCSHLTAASSSKRSHQHDRRGCGFVERRRDGSALLCYGQKVDAEPRSHQGSPLEARNLASRRSFRKPVQSLGQAQQFGHFPTMPPSVEASHSSQVALGPKVAGDACQNSGLLSLRIRNEGARCYMIATCAAMMWACLQGSFSPVHLWGRKVGLCFWRELQARQSRIHALSQLPSFCQVIAAWPDWNVQHDVCEFLLHIASLFESQASHIQWQARYSHERNGIIVQDTGSVLGALTLGYLQQQKKSLHLQDLVNQWHAQWVIHALTKPAKVVAVQLGRFLGLRKVHTPVTISDKVRLPVFHDSSISVQWHVYRVIASILHKGPRPNEGHYQTLCLDRSDVWLCDDASDPVLLSEADLTNSGHYVLWMVHENAYCPDSSELDNHIAVPGSDSEEDECAQAPTGAEQEANLGNLLEAWLS